MNPKQKQAFLKFWENAPETGQAILKMGVETRKKRQTDRQFRSALKEIQNLKSKNK